MIMGNFESWRDAEIMKPIFKLEISYICWEVGICSCNWRAFFVCLFVFFCIFVVLFPVKTTAWRTSQSPYPRDTQMGSSPTATVAIESRWRCRNTWQRFWEEGTDRELGTKDVDLPICSVVKAPKLPSCVYTSSR